MITIELNNPQLQAWLQLIESTVGDLKPLMRSIAAELTSQTEENFEDQGRPPWAALSAVTVASREKTGTWPGQILQVSAGGLAASIVSRSDHNSALVGSNKPYAAMMQFGGEQARFPHLWGDIPGRPYLPMDDQGQLQPEAEEAILDLALAHLETAGRV